MISGLDLADLISYAEAHDGKVVLAGDLAQLQAVENGGGMALLADRLGYVQLTEPVRFRAGWERAASMRLRAGDTTVLAEYDQHARIRGGEPEQVMDAAARAYVALTAAGTDALLMAADHSTRKELSRRIRDDLIGLGLVQPGPAVAIADGAVASPGDLITCTRNDHAVEAGEPGRTLANGDLLRIEAITSNGLLVRRALEPDRATGRRRWTDRQFLFTGYHDAEPGYAVTDHVAQGRTVHTGLALISGNEDRQHAYVALTRGTDTNMAFVFTVPPQRADPAPGPRPAPELARYDRVTTARAGEASPAAPAATDDALGVLAGVLERDGQLQSATQARDQALADADHLAVLNAIWIAETTHARTQRYRDLYMAALPAGYRQEPGHQAKWLWRTLRAAELAGLEPAEALAAAIGERDLAGAREVASVIGARLRRRAGTLRPLPAGSWSAQLPQIADPERRAFAAEIATLMDERKARIGQHAAATAASWAVSALGPVPEGQPLREQWQRQAASIGAYRELSGYDHPADPIGPEPVTGSPDLRAAWHEALATLGPVDGPDVRGMPGGMLAHLRDTYPIETAWAPPWAGDELRQARTGAWDARLAALRATAEADAAARHGRRDEAARQRDLAASYHALHEAYQQREAAFAAAMADRIAWDDATRQQRQLAIAADAELRRRHPGQHYAPLRAAESQPGTRDQLDEPMLSAPDDIRSTEELIAEVTAQHREFARALAERKSPLLPAASPGHADPGPPFPAWTGGIKDAILQPPKPQIEPSARIRERVAGRDLDLEAAD
jgi:AAA domain-containing protein